MTSEERAARVKAAHATLEREVESLVTDADWRAMLDQARRFHKYSFGNLMLIAAQCPGARAVAGFWTWQSAHRRQVKRGEKAISIFYPYTVKVEDEGAPDGERVFTRFGYGGRNGSVFDVSQTQAFCPSCRATFPYSAPSRLDRAEKARRRAAQAECEVCGGTGLDPANPPMPSIFDFAGEVEGETPLRLVEGLRRVVAEEGFTLESVSLGGGMANGAPNGVTTYATKTIKVEDALGAAQWAKTLAHEVAHMLMHGPEAADEAPNTRSRVEVEAESVAYIVCGVLGLGTTDYSFPYVAHWAGEDGPKAVQETGERVMTTAKALIGRIEDYRGLESGISADGHAIKDYVAA